MDSQASVPAMAAPPRTRDNPWTRSRAGMIGASIFLFFTLACLGTLGRTLPRVDDQSADAALLPPTWAMRLPPDWADPGVWGGPNAKARDRVVAGYHAVAAARAAENRDPSVTPDDLTAQDIRSSAPHFWLGTDKLGRDVFVRCLAGGGVSIGVGLAAATISVVIGTLYGALAGYAGGRTDAVMMRVVDILYGLPYVLLVVLLAVAGDALVDRFAHSKALRAEAARNEFVLAEAYRRADPSALEQLRQAEGWGAIASRLDSGSSVRRDLAALAATEHGPETIDQWIAALLGGDETVRQAIEDDATVRAGDGRLPSPALNEKTRSTLRVVILLAAIGGVSWLTMARVIRGQVLSLKAYPFMEAARALGLSVPRQFVRHMLPNLLAPIIVYATLTVPQAILQESFLSFLGIGIQPPLPSWGNLAAEGLAELNTVHSRWWLLVFPCVLLGATLLALNFMGEGLREAFDPRRARS